MSTVRLIWKCCKPSKRARVRLCESFMTKAAEEYGMDTAIIRKEPHDTSRIGGRYVRTGPHITGDILNTKVNKGYAVHWYVNARHTAALPADPPKAPNPKIWELKDAFGKGFVFVEDPETEV